MNTLADLTDKEVPCKDRRTGFQKKVPFGNLAETLRCMDINQ
jgi:hypothetical protein